MQGIKLLVKHCAALVSFYLAKKNILAESDLNNGVNKVNGLIKVFIFDLSVH